MEKFIRASGLPIRIATQGDHHAAEQAVVLLHGYLESLEVWDDLAQQLGKHIYTLALDLPGHGLSGSHPSINTMELMADVVREVQAQLGIQKIWLVGHSMGGYASLAFAQKYPQQLAGLCLFHSTPNADSPEKRTDRDREIALIEANKRDLLVQTTLPKMFAPQNLRRMQQAIAAMAGVLHFVDNAGIVACIRGMKEREDTGDVLTSLRVPLLFIFGKHDVYIGWESTAQAMIKKFPHAQVAALENSGHCGFCEEPEVAVQALLDFLKIAE
ncbi:alpha/beta hydrolase [Bacteroidia bacterium]|nr:alpha/beta hydrolase [Bacteroidia bacterium]